MESSPCLLAVQRTLHLHASVVLLLMVSQQRWPLAWAGAPQHQQVGCCLERT